MTLEALSDGEAQRAVLQADREARAAADAEYEAAHGGGCDAIEPVDSTVPKRYRRTDMGNCERFVDGYGGGIRYCFAWNCWLYWDSQRWVIDGTGHVMRLAKASVRAMWSDIANVGESDRQAAARWAMQSQRAERLNAMITLAQCEVPIGPEVLDADQWALNTTNGTLDLRTGTSRPHRREDYITKLCPTDFDADAKAPTWEAFLDQIFDGQVPVIRWLQKFIGHCLTGDVREQLLVFLHGVGANGKSTFMNVILEILGEYAMQAVPDLLLAKATAHPTEKADLFGRRLVACCETDGGRTLAEATVKQLTGGEKVRARKMRQDFWEFEPSHKLIMISNHKPEIQGRDHGIWRRIILVPFAVVIPDEDQDKDLPEKLQAEKPGILQWCLEGCLLWQSEGLAPPPEIAAATQSYRESQDVVGEFLDETCVTLPQARVRAGELYAKFREWSASAGETAISQRRFGEMITERGFQKVVSNGKHYVGLGLRSE